MVSGVACFLVVVVVFLLVVAGVVWLHADVVGDSYVELMSVVVVGGLDGLGL